MAKSFDQLLEDFLYDKLAPEEISAFLSQARQPANANRIGDAWQQKLENVTPDNLPVNIDMEEKFTAMLARAAAIQEASIPKKIFSIRRIAVAAAIVSVIAAGSYLVFHKPVQQPTAPSLVQRDVKAPAQNRAKVTLANGQVVFLDSVSNGQLALQSNVKLIKLANGQISYEGKANEVLYNTLSNPRGSQVIDMTLSDGSRVWLNAGSSVTYPVAFTGNERKVTVDGEAYFEITHDRNRPFMVSKGEVEVTVLGTHFNVNAYDDEKSVRVTLLEGRVRVGLTPSASGGEGSERSVILKPGEQAIAKVSSKGGDLEGASPLAISHSPDLEEVMAWKNGRFEFRGTDIETIMKQVARWYDVDIVYEGSKPDEEFMGGTSRQDDVSALLKVLEATGKIRFRVEGQKVIVSK